MARSSANPQRSYHRRWFSVLVCLLTILGLISYTGFTIAHWVQRQVLTTDNYVAMVTPLPKNPEVASALSSYTVNQLFVATDLSNKIEQALPERITFLADPLSAQLQARLTNRTKQLVQSDKFTEIWVAANKTASQRLLANARGTNPTPEKHVQFKLNMSALRAQVAGFLGKNAPVDEASATTRPQSDLVVNLKSTREQVHSYVRTADFLNGTLGLLAVVSLVGAIVLVHWRRCLLLIIGISIVIIGLLQLIGVKALRPVIINELQNASFRPAAGEVYDTLVGTFRRTATVSVILGSSLALVTYLCRRQLLDHIQPLKRWLESARMKAAQKRIRSYRKTVRRYRWHAAGAAVLIGLVLMAFVLSLDWVGVIRTILFILLTIEVINLVAARTEDMPMKQ